ncbi:MULTISPECIES: hypothetical protein [Xanthomonas]|uniref:hypothetical protein n=1 Tax=Xanthomonas TaxID=338 RepID=UPI001ADA30F4|nr:hypothetical protein [Xanthomonas phaseoli]MBO9767131.1 hypothetical protein [Xanthomonas phaseoli pv. dieffenbachiae]MBO9775153.1 hypothetical protein [Xanthomonas phaseoli pv. dieffenbachiae]MBO9779464.1 hypothetical protein [Xanthomonas phaseoli pv. dieffenbachiae]MBO9795412.1 hypothetical protein [Xanthomonas phaseoli pv. dieffenbachiae]MBO9799711.1 hypothetical protein [Xanthomonas phaseoli pv. dieffenbachiae]
MLYMPPPRETPQHDDTLQVYFVPRPQQTPPTPQQPPQEPERKPRVASAARAAPPVTHTPPPPRQSAAATAPVSDSMSAQLYTRDGRLRMAQVDPMAQTGSAVPPGMADERAQAKARKIMERVNPVQYQETRVAKDWKSDGTLGDVAVQEMNRGMKKFNDMLNGPQTQVAKARPPPDVRFNPALAGNQGEMGSEATGDAYKSAPIAHETLPDLKGEASRRIREALAALEQRSARCDASRRTSLLSPVRTHLSDLERAEHALNNGADPVMAAQMLPRQADSAYDLARRALWYADRQLKQCALG